MDGELEAIIRRVSNSRVDRDPVVCPACDHRVSDHNHNWCIHQIDYDTICTCMLNESAVRGLFKLVDQITQEESNG